MPPRRFKGNRKYELTVEGVSKKFVTKVQLRNRRWTLEGMICESREHIAKTERRISTQNKELEMIRRVESGEAVEEKN